MCLARGVLWRVAELCQQPRLQLTAVGGQTTLLRSAVLSCFQDPPPPGARHASLKNSLHSRPWSVRPSTNHARKSPLPMTNRYLVMQAPSFILSVQFQHVFNLPGDFWWTVRCTVKESFLRESLLASKDQTELIQGSGRKVCKQPSMPWADTLHQGCLQEVVMITCWSAPELAPICLEKENAERKGCKKISVLSCQWQSLTCLREIGSGTYSTLS